MCQHFVNRALRSGTDMNAALRKTFIIIQFFFLIFAFSLNALLLLLARNLQTVSFPLSEHFIVSSTRTQCSMNMKYLKTLK